MRSAFISVVIGIMALLPMSAHSHVVALDSGTYVKVEVCSENIFRVRMSSVGDFPQSLMERYGLVCTDWEETKVTMTESGSKLTFATSSYALTVDKTTGKVSLADTDGRIIVEEILFHQPGTRKCGDLAAVIHEKFAGLRFQNLVKIIGDDDGYLSEKDKTEGGDPFKSSVVSISMKEGERFYGGGNTSRDHIQHRGELLRMWTTYQLSEIPMPFMMSSGGWGIYNNTTCKNYFDIGYSDSDSFNIYNTCREADLYLMAGEDMPAVLKCYTQVTGGNYLLPKWAYGFCYGPHIRENQWDILNHAAKFREMDIPCDVLWLEPQWMEKNYDFSTSKKWNYDKFSPEPTWKHGKYPKQYWGSMFIGRLRGMGYHLGLWICEDYDLSIAEEDAIAEAQGRDTSGLEHWMDHLKPFIDLGVEGFKMDPARNIGEHTYKIYHNGLRDNEMHNLNQVLLPKQMATMYRNHTGKRSWHHYCGGWSGTQRWSASTSGDNGGGKVALFDQLNLGMSGYVNTSCDVMFVPLEEEMQSLHFGVFLPWIQVNSWMYMMHPAYYDAPQQKIYRDYIKLRYSLLPYIYSSAIEGALTGMPIVRSMPLIFPDDRKVDDMSSQYMFGPSFCVGIFTDEVYLPEGVWTDYWTGEKVISKGEMVKRECPSDRAGLLFVRGGAIVPTMEAVPYIGTKPLDSLVVKVFPDGDSEYVMYDCDAESYGYESGLVAKTRFECSQTEKNVSFVVNPVEGSFENMPSVRSYTFEFYLDNRPSKVVVNDVKVRDWSWENGVLILKVTDAQVAEKLEISII